jgi:nucleotide-binding universal stress UspA family protein
VLSAEIILLSVIDPEDIDILEATTRGLEKRSAIGGSTVGSAVRTPGDVINQAFAQAEDDLKVEAEIISTAGVKSSIRAGAGSPAEVIVSGAHAESVDLIAMATRRESALARGVLGSVLHSTSIPLLTLYPGGIHEFEKTSDAPERVIVPLDGSTLSESSVKPAMEIAQASRAEIIFTEILRLPFFGVGVAGMEYGADDYAGDFRIDVQKKEISSYLQGFVDDAEVTGVKASANVRSGSPSQQIIEEASEIDGSIIVMASHGSGGLKR